MFVEGNYIYQISTEYEFDNCGPAACEIYTYTLYKCKLDYTACNPLPIYYTTDFEYFTYLEANEISNEINLFDSYDDTLIFTWGEHPRCYVEGCEILEK